MNRFSPFDAHIPSPENSPVAPDFAIANRSDLPILADANFHMLENDCWNKIGVTGDRSCPELLTHVHCRNCPVFATAGQRLFERDSPAGLIAEWTKQLAEPDIVTERGTVSVLIFRVGHEWLAIDTELLVEIAELRPIHTIPGRSNERLVGLVSIRGELELCLSLGGLLGIEMQYPPSIAKTTIGKATRETTHHDSEQGSHASVPSGVTHSSDRVARAMETDHVRLANRERVTARLMVVNRANKRWVVPVDDVDGVWRFAPTELTNVPSTVSGAAMSFSKGIFWHNDRRIGFLDETRLFESFERSLA